MSAHPVEKRAEFEGYQLASLCCMEHNLGGIKLYLSAFIYTLEIEVRLNFLQIKRSDGYVQRSAQCTKPST